MQKSGTQCSVVINFYTTSISIPDTTKPRDENILQLWKAIKQKQFTPDMTNWSNRVQIILKKTYRNKTGNLQQMTVYSNSGLTVKIISIKIWQKPKESDHYS